MGVIESDGIGHMKRVEEKTTMALTRLMQPPSGAGMTTLPDGTAIHVSNDSGPIEVDVKWTSLLLNMGWNLV